MNESPLIDSLHLVAASSGDAAATATVPRLDRDAASPRDDLATGSLVGEYRIEKKIGQGAMGTVYAAVHPLIGARVAVKVIHRALAENNEAGVRFIREARAVNQVNHPNVVNVFAFGTLDDGRPYYVMELLEGETLASLLARGRLPYEECLDILAEVCEALKATHDRGIIHRDLKPDNIFMSVRAEGRARPTLLDFGLAKMVFAADKRTTQEGLVVGTPLYVSPEQARGQRLDHRTDIYSLGVVAYEMLLGERPFDGDNPLDVLLAQASDAPPEPRTLWRDIPPALDNLLLRMLKKDCEARPPWPEILDTLAALRALGPPAPRPATSLVVTALLVAAILTAGVISAALVLTADSTSSSAAPVPRTAPPISERLTAPAP